MKWIKIILPIISTLTSTVIPGILYTYYYPWLYNKINSYTERGPFLDDKIDLLNAVLVFLVTGIVFFFIFIIFIPIFLKILIKKYK